MRYCGKKETQGHGSNSICGEPFYHVIWQCETCKALDAAETKPIDMILHCPACGTQHIDAPEDKRMDYAVVAGLAEVSKDYRPWANPPHRSHLCASCGHIWRPADVPTNGVSAIATRGKDDSETVANCKAWQPIETAPKDGTHILLVRATNLQKGSMHAGLYAVDWWRQHKDAAGFTGWGKFNPSFWPPTHWMPLPRAPR